MKQTQSRALTGRYFTRADEPEGGYAGLAWKLAEARIDDAAGKVFFEQKDMEFPKSWSQQAVNIVASKYFKGPQGSPRRESSVRQLIGRVTGEIMRSGLEQGYFDDAAEASVFRDELTYILVRQMACFNSPVWFNVGVTDERSSGWCWDAGQGVRAVKEGEHKPQPSACFIVGPEDTMESIFDWVWIEAMIFKCGSGSGANLSKLRSWRETLTSGGTPSGPLSFAHVADAAAGAIRSGGKHRRAAKMIELNSDHPDIFEFVRSKAEEERKIRRLIAAGWKNDYNDPDGAQAAARFQNENHSMSADDAFLEAVENDGYYSTKAVRDGRVIETFKARKLMREAAEAAWTCGDPGLQCRDTMNKWNMVAGSGEIRGSNPCAEYIFLDDTACNLASINLMKFRQADGSFQVDDFERTVDTMILAMDILVDMGSYPSKAICQNSHELRPLGLGFANLGAYVMSLGCAYDSSEARELAGGVTAVMSGRAYAMSARIARRMGPFPEWNDNAESAARVLGQHRAGLNALEGSQLRNRAYWAWDEAYLAAREGPGVRNAQVTVIAPTGTIAFMMDCDTTGIEPELNLVRYKYLAGGGTLKIVNQTVGMALERLGASGEAIEKMTGYIDQNGSLEGCPGASEHVLQVLDCALPSGPSGRSIPWKAHLEMMAAVQPFVSGAISKTINMPNNSTVEDIERAYLLGWKLGLKCIALYRDGCKSSQPMMTKEAGEARNLEASGAGTKPGEAGTGTRAPQDFAAGTTTAGTTKDQPPAYAGGPGKSSSGKSAGNGRRRLPATRQSVCHKFEIAGHEGYLHVGLYEDGSPGEVFIKISKAGSTMAGIVDNLAMTISMALQYGVPLAKLVEKFRHSRYDPSGITANPDIRFADSIMDYIAHWMERTFLENAQASTKGVEQAVEPASETQSKSEVRWKPETRGEQGSRTQSSMQLCASCGSLMEPSGVCWRCPCCGGTSGCS